MGIISYILSRTDEYNLPKEEIYSLLYREDCINILNSRKPLDNVV